jgi:WD40 repeat protein
MKRYKTFLVIAFFIFFYPVTHSQKSVNPNFETHRLDYRDIGYPAATEIPADDSPIASLLAHSGGKIYGATTGKQSYLFVYDFRTNKASPLGKLPNAKGVHHAMVEDDSGYIYIGTGLNELELPALTKDIPHGRRMIEYQLWDDIKNKYKDFEGGHIFLYDPSGGDEDIYFIESEAQVKDLGVPVPGNSIYALTINQRKDKIYGISYPDAIFFELDLATGKIKSHGEWLTVKSYPGPERSWRGVPRALACMPDGKVYSSGDDGLIYFFDPATGKIQSSDMRIPGEYWETQNYNGFPVAEQLILDGDSSVLGSSSDGFIFRMNVDSHRLTVLGKPRVERRVRAMTLGLDRRLYMICGEKDNVCRMFAFDLSGKQEGFLDYGVLGVDRSPYYSKIGYQFDSMCTAADGTIFIGEGDRRAKLFFYIPGGQIMKGGLNPTNPR